MVDLYDHNNLQIAIRAHMDETYGKGNKLELIL
jgi:hypothetical protein